MKVSLPDLILQEVFFSFLSTLSTLVLSLPPTMADNTRLEEAITILTQTQSSLHSKLNDVISRFTILESRSPDRPLSLPPPRRKLDVPWFDGANAMSWIFKISQLFDYHGTPDSECLQVASFYLDGPALSWFQWMHRNNQISSWSDFLQALEMRFAPSFYEDPRGALFKLTQQGTINSYLSEFESLANRIVGLFPPFLLSCFVSCLSPNICREVQAL